MQGTVQPFRFRHPVRCCILGASASGKSTFVRRLLHNLDALFYPVVPQNIYYVYVFQQSWFLELPQVSFQKTLPTKVNAAEPNLLIVDDLLTDRNVLSQLALWYTRGSHHCNTSVFLLSQAIFMPITEYRLLSQNTSVFVLFYMPRGMQQIHTFARQIFPKEQARDFLDTYISETRHPFGYILLDLTPGARFPVRSHILPDETSRQRVYTFKPVAAPADNEAEAEEEEEDDPDCPVTLHWEKTS
jgi:hypothetical protein